MSDAGTAKTDQLFLSIEEFEQLFVALRGAGYLIVGPTVRDEVIVYEQIESSADLPRGWTDDQRAGHYRLKRRDDEALFGYVVGPHSWKKYLFPPELALVRSQRTGDGWDMRAAENDAPAYAFVGVRACELAALAIQDKVFLSQEYQDPHYAAIRERALIVAVQCTQAASTCFCTSMDSGPECRTGFDLALTELEDGFVVKVGTSRGRDVVSQIATAPASSTQQSAASQARQRAVDEITRRLPQERIREDLLENLDHPRWDDVAERCLSCTNCTLVCPTCFCHSVSEVGDLTGDAVERRRQWDSCFNPDFSYMNGGVIRNNIKSRYRQWLTHKLATWHDQFDTSGCVGCGRCITWCPVAIDLTEEVAAIRGDAS